MNRRAFLASSTSAVALLSGCTSSQPEIDADPIDPDPSQSTLGLAPNPTDVPEIDIDKSEFATINAEGITVEMIPLDVAYYWYNTHKARFVDARVRERYEELHIAGAVHSPAPDGGSNDPLVEVGDHERIVSYCTCPHHLPSLRAASRIEEGNAGVYALNPGFEPWLESDYPISGTNTSNPSIRPNEDYSNIQ